MQHNFQIQLSVLKICELKMFASRFNTYPFTHLVWLLQLLLDVSLSFVFVFLYIYIFVPSTFIVINLIQFFKIWHFLHLLYAARFVAFFYNSVSHLLVRKSYLFKTNIFKKEKIGKMNIGRLIIPGKIVHMRQRMCKH